MFRQPVSGALYSSVPNREMFRQPVGHLKEILKELCDYNVKQPHRGMWELKPEFRHYQKEDDPDKKDDLDSSDSD